VKVVLHLHTILVTTETLKKFGRKSSGNFTSSPGSAFIATARTTAASAIVFLSAFGCVIVSCIGSGTAFSIYISTCTARRAASVQPGHCAYKRRSCRWMMHQQHSVLSTSGLTGVCWFQSLFSPTYKARHANMRCYRHPFADWHLWSCIKRRGFFPFTFEWALYLCLDRTTTTLPLHCTEVSSHDEYKIIEHG
jgi:hypothetical protein